MNNKIKIIIYVNNDEIKEVFINENEAAILLNCNKLNIEGTEYNIYSKIFSLGIKDEPNEVYLKCNFDFSEE